MILKVARLAAAALASVGIAIGANAVERVGTTTDAIRTGVGNVANAVVPGNPLPVARAKAHQTCGNGDQSGDDQAGEGQGSADESGSGSDSRDQSRDDQAGDGKGSANESGSDSQQSSDEEQGPED
jgi:hypothetical protein